MKKRAIIHKGQTVKGELKKRIRDLKGELLADYGSSVLVRIESKKLDALQSEGWRVRRLPEETDIQISAFRFNSTKKEFQSTVRRSKAITLPSGRSHHLMRLAGPIHPKWKESLEGLEVTIYEQVHPNVYLIGIDNSKISNLKRRKFVESVSPYYPELKINQTLLTGKIQSRLASSRGLKKTPLPSDSPKQQAADAESDQIRPYRKDVPIEQRKGNTLELVLFDASDVKKVAKAAKDNGAEVINQSGGYVVVQARLDELSQLATIPQVKEINPHDEFRLHNNVATEIINADEIQNDFELDGSGQIVAVADTGLDTGVDDASMSDDFAGRIVNIYDLGRPGDASDPDGHGTHVAGSVLGDGSNSNGNVQGLAPAAQVVFQSIMDAGGGLGGIPADLGLGLFDVARDDGARIHTNSWGAPVNGAYTISSSQADTFAFNNREFLILFSAGNDAPNGIGTPGTGKNVLTIGASESLRGLPASVSFPASPVFPAGPTATGMDQQADNQNDIAGFSSLGPAQNNRIKPDVVAPGSWILSARSSVAVYDSGPDGLGPNEVLGGTGDEDGVFTHEEAVGLGLPGQGILRMGDENTPPLPPGSGASAFEDYMYLSGTSMATPIMAGSCAMIRQYLIDQRGHTPSAALIKALVVNGAVDMGLADTFQGWGRSDLKNTLVPLGTERVQFDDTLGNALVTGDFRTYSVHVASSVEPLIVTLVWRDPAGATIQNQLFLRVRHVATSTEFSFETEGSPVLNNTQKVVVAAPAPGVYEIEVEALSITTGIPEFPAEIRQDYALVVSNALGFSCNPSDIVQVLDRSGSMGFYGYMEPAKQRASEVVDLLKINDQIGVVSFAASASPGIPTPLTPISSQDDKTAIKGGIAAVTAGGNTDLREALEDGVSTLGADTGRPRAIIFLSDGHHTVGTAAIDNVFLDGIAAQNIKVYTIALGPASDFIVLDNIANRTGTGATYTVDSAATLHKLHEVYYDIMGAVDCGSIVHLNSAPLITGTDRADKVIVDRSAMEATFMISWEAGTKRVQTWLESPSGKTYKPSSKEVAFIGGDSYHLYRFALPEPGTWSVFAKGNNEDQTEKTTIGAIVESEVKCNVGYRREGEKILVEVQSRFRKEKIKKLSGYGILSAPTLSIADLLEKYKDELERIKVNKRLLKGASDNRQLAQLNILAARLARKGTDIFARQEKKLKFETGSEGGTLKLTLDIGKFKMSGGVELKLHIKAKGDFGDHVCTKIIPIYIKPKKTITK